jgi:deoxyribodipyrimidine photo-lyase
VVGGRGRGGRPWIRRGARLTGAAAPTIVWFRRDLRIHDHPALLDSVRSGAPVVALFVIDPRLLTGRFESPNRSWFLARSLDALSRQLAACGNPLVIRRGDPAMIVPAVAREVGAEAVAVSRDYTPFGRARDRAVAGALDAAGIAFRQRRGVLIHEPEDVLTGQRGAFRVFSPFHRAWERLPMRDVLPAPETIASWDDLHSDVHALDELRAVQPTADSEHLLEAGAPAARERLARWIEAGPEHGPAIYASTRDRLADPHGTSRLSQDLRFGLLSPVEVAEAVRTHHGDTDGPRRFLSELAWRDFYAHGLWHEPRIAREPFMARYASLRWPGTDADAEGWREGRTGYPIVDAAMRQLAATGFMPNRARMIVASFLVKDLLVDWRVGEAHFMRHLVDGDPASNLGGWQWAASVGTDAQPYFRVFNPVTQGERFDPDGEYVRHWVRELGRVPDARVHAPWTMTEAEQQTAGCRIGVDYPAPIVDHAEARLRALDLFGAVGPGRVRA